MYANMSKASPRSVGSIPAEAIIGSALTPSTEDIADLIILRRCEKAASISAKTFNLNSSSPSGLWRLKKTNFESTLGTGQKMLRATVPAEVKLPHQAALADGDP